MTNTDSNSSPELQHAGIMFADIRGYNNLETAENSLFHSRLFRELWDDVINESSPDLEYGNLWGDGLMCIGKDLAKLAHFSLKLAEAFDQKEWRKNLHVPLRLRISLDSGNMGLSERDTSNRIEQYLSTNMVKPARLEPVVRPGQIWCTSNFRNSLLDQYNKEQLDFILDNFDELFLSQNYNPNALVARIRAKRDNEETLQSCEHQIREAQRQSNGSLFCQAIQALLQASSEQFIYLSRYLSWYEIIIEMSDRFQKYRECLTILEKFKVYVEEKKWMSRENIVYFTCFWAKCRSHLPETTGQDLQKFLEELQELYNNEKSPEELLMLIAQTYKEIVIILCKKTEISNNEKTNHFIYCHDEMLSKIFKKEQSISPRFFPELASLLTYQKINHRAALCMAETALFVQCLTRDQKIRTEFIEKKELLAQWLITDFKARKPRNPSEILTVSIAYILLGDQEGSAQALRGQTLPPDLQYELKRRLEIISDFPRMDDSISNTALNILEQYCT